MKMATEIRGTAKLLEVEDGLCSLTAEELLQVSGGCLPKIDLSKIDIFLPPKFPNFPRGMFPPDVLTANPGNLISNGF